MDLISKYHGEAQMPATGIGGSLRAVNPNVTEALEYKKAHLEEELAKVNAALDALKANPAVMEILNLLQRAIS